MSHPNPCPETGLPQVPAGAVPAPPPAAKVSKRLPCLDGWRAVSICLVLGTHTNYLFNLHEHPWVVNLLWVFGGTLGVKFFFVISGFLITYLMIQEDITHGEVNLRRFYIRRALRILPVYFVFLLVLFTLQLFTPFHQTGVQWLGNLTFTTDFIPAAFTADHLWSLSVEEQFYLVWPVLFVLFYRKNRRLLLGLLLVALVSAPVCRAIPNRILIQHPNLLQPFFAKNGHPIFVNVDSLAIGCLAGMLLVMYEQQVKLLFQRYWKLLVLLGAAMIALPVALHKMQEGGVLLPAFGNSLQASGFVLIMLSSVLLPRYFQPLEWRFVRYLGLLSYSMYIWQQIYCTKPATYGLNEPVWMSFPWWLLPVFLTGAISFHYLEKPLMALRSKFRIV